MVNIPQVRSCCWGYKNLEDGVHRIAFYMVFYGVVEAVGYLLVVAFLLMHTETTKQKMMKKDAIPALVLYPITSIIQLLLGLWLCFGLRDMKMKVLKYWMVGTLIVLALLLLIDISLIGYYYFRLRTVLVLVGMFNKFVLLYFIIVVYSYYRKNVDGRLVN